jgi:hypothetical protein
MVHHGYERSPGYHTSSCEAAFRFAPLEVSCEGLQWLVVVKENSQYRDKQRLARKAAWQIIYQGEFPKLTTIEPENPGWALAVEQQAGRLEEKIESRGRQIERLARQLKEWKPTAWPRLSR